MNPMIKRLVGQDMITEEQGEVIEKAIMRKESILVSGHRSAGIRPLMASLMAVAKSNFESVQVKGFDDLEKETEFFLIPGLDGVDFEGIISKAISKEGTAFVSVKEPEYPFSLMKILKQNFRNGDGIGKKILTLECVKENDEPKVAKITEMVLNEKGRIERTNY